MTDKPKRVQFPKFEFSDLLHRREVAPGHTWKEKEDPHTYNLMICEACGLEGWLAYGNYDKAIDGRKEYIASYRPGQGCKGPDNE